MSRSESKAAEHPFTPFIFTDPLGNVTVFTYDTAGNKLTEKRPDGGTNRWIYDGLSRVVHQVDPLNQTNSFAYDLAGNVTNLWDGRGYSYGFTYDVLGRKLTMGYPDGTSEGWAYDALGRATNLTTRAGQTLGSTYDNRGRVTLANWSDGTPDVAMDYDAAGRLLTNTTSVSVLVYAYDDVGQVLSEQQTVSGQSSRTVSYTYDTDGNRLSLAYPGGTVVTNTFTSRNQLLGLYADGTPALATFSYDAGGGRTNLSLENGVGTRYAYDAARRMTNMTLTTNSVTFSAFVYGYNAMGNRTNRTETLGGSSWTDAYGYDGTDQVTNVNYSSGARVVGYAYDAVGNRTSVVDNSQTTSYAVNAANQYTNITGASPVTNLTWSTNGNLTSGGGWSHTYDAQNRLTEVAASNPVEGSKKVVLAYDGRNRCVNRKTYSWATDNWQLITDDFFTYDSWNLIEERNSGGTLAQTYVHGPRVDEILMKVTASNAIYYQHDALGNVTSLTDASGVIVERYLYDTFGHPTILDGGGNVIGGTGQTNRFLFTGREWLAEVSLYDYRNRMYSALLGRFLQTDPIGFAAGDVNIYRYVGNGPLNGIDPLGLEEPWNTPDGSKIDHEHPDHNDPRWVSTYNRSQTSIKTWIPSATVEGPSTISYNCHAYAFTPGVAAKMDDPTPIFTAHYNSINQSAATEGDRIVIFKWDKIKKKDVIAHSGILYPGGLVMSKMGNGPLIKSTLDDLKKFYEASRVDYYTPKNQFYQSIGVWHDPPTSSNHTPVFTQ